MPQVDISTCSVLSRGVPTPERPEFRHIAEGRERRVQVEKHTSTEDAWLVIDGLLWHESHRCSRFG